MGRTSSLTEWAHFIKTSHKASMSYWWVYCRHCVLAAMAVASDQARPNQPPTFTAKEVDDFIETLPVPTTTPISADDGSTATTVPLVGRRSVMKAHLAHCVFASPIPPNPIVKRRAGKRGVHCAIAEWAHFDRLEKEGYIGNTNYFPVVCKYCAHAYNVKERLAPPEVFAGRKESMRRHLLQCRHFAGNLPDNPTKPNASKSLSEWEFFLRLDRQPGSMYHFAKCKSCTEAHAANPEEHPEPKIILGRKHNMQTHLANCQHMHHLRDAIEDIAFSSDEDNDGDVIDGGVAIAAPSALASTAVHLGAVSPAVEGGGHDALVHFTIEYNLPFSWVDSPNMQLLLPTLLPTSGELATTILHSVQRRIESQQQTGSNQTLVIEALTKPTIGADEPATFAAWLVDAQGFIVPQWMPGQCSLTWPCRDTDLASVVAARLAQNMDTIVAVVLPPAVASECKNQSAAHWYCHESVGPAFHSLMQTVLQDDMVGRVLRTALQLAPMPIQFLRSNWAQWLQLVDRKRSQYPLELDFWHQLDSVGTLLSSLSLANGLVRVNSLTLAHTMHLLNDIYRRNQGLNRTTLLQLKLERELEGHWQSMEQPLMVLAYVLHPEFRGKVALHPRRSKLTSQVLGEVAMYYFSKFFREPPRDPLLASVVMDFVDGRLPHVHHVASTEHATFVMQVNEVYPDLARLMQRLLDIVPSFYLDSGHLSAHHYAPEEWQRVKYIAHCAPPSPPSSHGVEEIATVDELLLKWRSQGLRGTKGSLDLDGGIAHQDIVPKVTLIELFGSTTQLL